MVSSANGKVKGSLTGISIGAVTETQKIWRSFQALGDIAFAYSYSIILIEIQVLYQSLQVLIIKSIMVSPSSFSCLQDTVKSPPSEEKTMKKATLVSVGVTTMFYMLCGCMGYAAFGDMSPGNLLTGFGFYNPYWLLDIANAAIVVHLVGAYQVYCQPLFAFIERQASTRFPDSDFVAKDIKIPIPGFKPFRLNFFRYYKLLFSILLRAFPTSLYFFI